MKEKKEFQAKTENQIRLLRTEEQKQLGDL